MRTIPELETRSLIVRPFSMGDFDAAIQLFDRDLYPPGLTPEARKRWLTWVVLNYEQLDLLTQPPYGDRAIVLKESGTLVGSIGMVPQLSVYGQLPYFGGRQSSGAQAEVGLYWAISPSYRRNGYAAEAAQALIEYLFETERLIRIIATTEHDNLASQGVMRKLGMQIESNPFPEPPWLQVVGVLENQTLG